MKVDVAIVGGGMVGASLALALRGLGVDVLLVEGVEPGTGGQQPSFDDRTTALGNASRRIFDSLGVWGDIAPQAAGIRTIHVSDAGRFGFARLRAEEQGIDAFGYVVANRVIGAALWGRLSALSAGVGPGVAADVGGGTDGRIEIRVPARAEDIEITPEGARFTVVSAAGGREAVGGEAAGSREASGSREAAESREVAGAREQVEARLLVAADGAHSAVRAAAAIEADVEDYDQVAIVANVSADHPHNATAYERFTPSGPIAVLPLYDGSYGVIWSCRPQDATEVLSLSDDAYLRELQKRFGWRAGRFVRVGRRASYPLKLTRAAATTATRTVLIGNAAQALHPVAGQGFNLGLRDAAMLAEVIANAGADGLRGAVGANTAAGDAAAGRAAGANTAASGAAADAAAGRAVGGNTAARGTAADAAAGRAVGARVDVGSPELLRRFAEWRAADRGGVVRFTDGLVKLFGSARPGVGILRNLGLLMFDLAPPAKSALARVSAGFGGRSPRLARGLPVREVAAGGGGAWRSDTAPTGGVGASRVGAAGASGEVARGAADGARVPPLGAGDPT